MATLKGHLQEEIIRYMDGELAGEEKRRIEEHLQACKECRELLSFGKEFVAGLSEINAADFKIKDSCPDS